MNLRLQVAKGEVAVAAEDEAAVEAAADGEKLEDVNDFVIAKADDLLELLATLGANCGENNGVLVSTELVLGQKKEDGRLPEGPDEEGAANRFDELVDPILRRGEILWEEAHSIAGQRLTRILSLPVLNVVLLSDKADPGAVLGVLDDSALH